MRNKKMMSKLGDWFNRNLGWFFINGRKQKAWNAYIHSKTTTAVDKQKEDNSDWLTTPGVQEFLESVDNPKQRNEEEYGIYTAGGLTNDKEGSFMKFINKLNKKKR